MDIGELVNLIAMIIAGASALAKLCEWLASMTESKRDDEFFARIYAALIKIQQLLRIPALNPKR